jgi:hypothetical protein
MAAADTSRLLFKRSLKAVILLLVLLVGGAALWTWATLNWSYSEGERAGYVQKFSRKGWLCKTWEGELSLVAVPGSTPEKFPFTVRDDKVAEQINAVMGRRVALNYAQHVGVPLGCFGETEYFVTGVRPVE